MQTGNAAAPTRRRFTAEEFERLGAVGILGEDDRVELIDGDIVEMTPIDSPHSGTVNALTAIFTAGLGARAVVAVQNPVRLDDFNEPQPDLAVLRARDDRYRRSHPGPADVLLLVEVAWSSQSYDRGVKAPLYARHGIREFWIVDVERRVVEVYREPGPEGYAEQLRREPGAALAPQAFPELEIGVEEIVGPG